MLVFGPVVSDTSKDHSSSIFRVKDSNKSILLGLFTLESLANTRVVTQYRMSGSMYESAELKLIIRVTSLDSSDENNVMA